ncbi:unnamed protein product [Diatraea saccharalis]|uniref:Kinesin motor domain-containing protein n=1 Tax=Diatraea saccharalis TaxID=40085 RepID=A0A9N9R4P8_9NEOP|nr:unnamed protein product [Diatraea saccharalis]
MGAILPPRFYNNFCFYSFLEIYNERVHDLLAGESAPPTCHSLPRRRGNARKDLRVREHPGKGPYVQNLRRVAIHSVDALLALVNEGARRRRTAATRRNSTSSRSHALLELATKNATLHLADLAGSVTSLAHSVYVEQRYEMPSDDFGRQALHPQASEKAGWEGCGGRQKEGANINKSLVALSNVISALVSGGGRGRFVPYRDSALTWLLKDCFTGGATTFIITTVSPSVACYGESASTLRWAARARQLPDCRVTVAPAPVARAVLLAHYTRLLDELGRNFIRYVPETGKISYDINHWTLNPRNDDSQLTTNKLANIGNIMNLLHPKTDAQSESTASSVASGSSDVINNTTDKLTNIQINQDIDKDGNNFFVPNLERTQSINDLKIIAPLRHKRRQYKSQEILPIDEAILMNQRPSNALLKHDAHKNNSEHNKDKSNILQTSVLYDNNQRAEIVASVTERLYNKIKKKEEAAASKIESVIDKKIMEPLSELRICTNARQRLVEISQKALRNKRRIGIPAHTQTRKTVTRVRDQGIDAQTDLHTYFYKNCDNYTIRCDAATETLPLTPRCKEVAVGSKYGTINFNDKSTLTEEKKIVNRNSFVMTDVARKCDNFTQTHIVPPPRRKRRGCYCNCSRIISPATFHANDGNASLISINISQTNPMDSETQSSDEDSESQTESYEKPSSVNMTPDLLTNHNTLDVRLNFDRDVKDETNINIATNGETDIKVDDTQSKYNSDFSDSDDFVLPRVKVDGIRKTKSQEIRDMILGRNDNSYPYNIILSPPRDRDQSKILVKFQESDIPRKQTTSVASQTSLDKHSRNLINDNTGNFVERNSCNNDRSSINSNSSESKKDSDSFVWQKGIMDDINSKWTNSLGRRFTPVYKLKNSRPSKSNNKLYKKFLDLNNEKKDNESSSNSSLINNNKDIISSDSSDSRDMFVRRRDYLESMLNFKSEQDCFTSCEQELLNSCNKLQKSVDKYESYIANYQNSIKTPRGAASIRTPTEYLQHLVQLRREVVKGNYERESSLGNKL